MATCVQALPSQASTGRQQFISRAFPYLLLGITLLSLVPRVLVGVSQFIQYDGFWHLFISTQDRWDQLYLEWNGDAHPPLYYLLLRLFASFGHSHLLYRVPSIVPAVAAVYVFGWTAGRLLMTKWLALTAAAAFAFAMCYIDLSIDLRGYPLALFFVLLAFDKLVDIFVDGRSLIAFGILTAIAISAEYFSILFFLACVVAAGVYGMISPCFRNSFIVWVRARPIKAAAAVLIPLAVTAFLFAIHINTHPIPQNNVMEFYWDRHVSPWTFLHTQLQRDLNYFLPIELHGPPVFNALLWIAVFVVLVFIVIRARKLETLPSTFAALLLILLVAALMIFSLLRLYPFGGFLRQQSIIFPFLVLTGFGIVDWLLSSTRVPVIKSAVVVLVAASVASSAIFRWETFPRSNVELRTAEYDNFKRAFPHPDAVYVDQFSLIAFYTHTYMWNWHLQARYRVPDRDHRYELTNDGQRFTVLRDFDAWNFDLLQPGFYSTLEAAMHAASLNDIDLFLLKQFPAGNSAGTLEPQKQSILSLAAATGLIADVRVYTDSEAYVEFKAK